MNLLLGFLPFATFAVGDHLLSTPVALALAAAVALALVVHGLAHGKALKWLDVGASVVFGSLAVYMFLAGVAWSVVAVRLAADAGLFAIVALSLVAGQPFTLQYAKERVAPEHWESAGFVSANRRLTSIWCAVFGAMVLADVGMLHGLPVSVGVILTLAALGAGLNFTKKALR
jgi:hypothetical protein